MEISKNIQTQLDEIEKVIAERSKALDLNVRQGVIDIGENLKEARNLFSIDKSHDSQFHTWIRKATPWSQSYVNRLITYSEIYILTAPIGAVRVLNEAQCRELTCVPKDKLAEVYKEIVEYADKETIDITAKLIRERTEKFRPETEPPEKLSPEIQFLKDRTLFLDSIRERIDKWPQEQSRIVANLIIEMLSEGY